MKRLNHNGVAMIPIRPDILALKMAVGKFPFAMATITTEEETVEGKTPRKKTAIQRSDLIPPSKKGIKRKVKRGNRRNVTDCINR